MSQQTDIAELIHWNDEGLVPAIAQDWQTGDVLMLAWMNAESLALTMAEKRAVYWSRSRQAVWRKGEESGNVQKLRELRIDCDADTVLMKVEQIGGIACHTGRRHCFFQRVDEGGVTITEDVLKDPETLYGKKV